MKDIYVHTFRHHSGRGNRTSKTVFPVSYGPFRDEDAAWEWVRQTGITRATKLMAVPAGENIEIPHSYLSKRKEPEIRGFLPIQTQRVSLGPLQNPGD